MIRKGVVFLTSIAVIIVSFGITFAATEQGRPIAASAEAQTASKGFNVDDAVKEMCREEGGVWKLKGVTYVGVDAKADCIKEETVEFRPGEPY